MTVNNPPVDPNKSQQQAAWEYELANEVRALANRPSTTVQQTTVTTGGGGAVTDSEFFAGTFTIYQRNTSAPAEPASTTFNRTTGVLTVPQQWFTDVPPGSDTLYTSLGQALGDGNPVTVDWGAPTQIVGTTGAAGADGASISVSQTKVGDTTTVTFTSTAAGVAPVTSTIDDGTDGADGQQGLSTFRAYADDYRPADTDFGGFGWGYNPTRPATHSNAFANAVYAGTQTRDLLWTPPQSGTLASGPANAQAQASVVAPPGWVISTDTYLGQPFTRITNLTGQSQTLKYFGWTAQIYCQDSDIESGFQIIGTAQRASPDMLMRPDFPGQPKMTTFYRRSDSDTLITLSGGQTYTYERLRNATYPSNAPATRNSRTIAGFDTDSATGIVIDDEQAVTFRFEVTGVSSNVQVGLDTLWLGIDSDTNSGYAPNTIGGWSAGTYTYYDPVLVNPTLNVQDSSVWLGTFEGYARPQTFTQYEWTQVVGARAYFAYADSITENRYAGFDFGDTEAWTVPNVGIGEINRGGRRFPTSTTLVYDTDQWTLRPRNDTEGLEFTNSGTYDQVFDTVSIRATATIADVNSSAVLAAQFRLWIGVDGTAAYQDLAINIPSSLPNANGRWIIIDTDVALNALQDIEVDTDSVLQVSFKAANSNGVIPINLERLSLSSYGLRFDGSSNKTLAQRFSTSAEGRTWTGTTSSVTAPQYPYQYSWQEVSQRPGTPGRSVYTVYFSDTDFANPSLQKRTPAGFADITRHFGTNVLQVSGSTNLRWYMYTSDAQGPNDTNPIPTGTISDSTGNPNYGANGSWVAGDASYDGTNGADVSTLNSVDTRVTFYNGSTDAVLAQATRQAGNSDTYQSGGFGNFLGWNAHYVGSDSIRPTSAGRYTNVTDNLPNSLDPNRIYAAPRDRRTGTQPYYTFEQYQGAVVRDYVVFYDTESTDFDPTTKNWNDGTFDIASTVGPTGGSAGRGYIYIANAGTPAAPTGGSYNFNTQVLTPPSGWSETEPDVKTMSAGQGVYYTRWIVSQSGTESSATPTYDTNIRQSVLVANDIASENYDGLRDTDYDSYVNDTTNTAGYYLDASNGTSIFQQAVVRGQSTVETATISGEPHISMGLGAPTPVLSNSLSSFTIGATGLGLHIGTIQGVSEFTLTDAIVGFNRNSVSGTYQLTSPTGVNRMMYALHPSTDTAADRGDPNGSHYIVGTSSPVLFRTNSGGVRPAFTFSGTSVVGHDYYSSGTYWGQGLSGGTTWTNMDPDTTYELYVANVAGNSFVSGTWTVAGPSGGGLTITFNSNESTLQTAGNGTVDKDRFPESTAAFLVGDNDTEFASVITGGLGLKVPSLLVWDGSSTEAFLPIRNPVNNTGAVKDAQRLIQPDAQLIVEVSYTDSGTKWATVPVVFSPSDFVYLQTESSRSGTNNYISIVGPEVKTAGGARVGSLVGHVASSTTPFLAGNSIAGSLRYIELNVSGASSGTAGRIRRVWRKFS